MDIDATLNFRTAQTVPYSMREMVKKELNRLVEEGTLESVEFFESAVPIVTVLKGGKKSIRFCSDFQMTVNPYIQVG